MPVLGAGAAAWATYPNKPGAGTIIGTEAVAMVQMTRVHYRRASMERRMGLARAEELNFTGRKLDVAEAQALGIVDRVTGAGRLLTFLAKTATKG